MAFHDLLSMPCNGTSQSLHNTPTSSITGISPSLMSYCLLLLSMASFFFILRKRRPTTLSLPPGPKPWPFIGSLPELQRNKPIFRWIQKMMEDINTEIMCIRLGKVHVITVTSPEIAVEFLRKQDTIFSSRPTILSAEVASRGYLTTALSPMGEQWKKMKRVICSEVLSASRHQFLQGKLTEEADHLVRFVYNQTTMDSSKAGVVNVRVIAQQCCGNVTRKMIFGKRFFGKGMVDGGPGVEEEEHVSALFSILDYLYAFSVSDYIPFLRGRVDLDGHEKNMRAAVAGVAKYQDPEIDERIRCWTEGGRIEQEDLLDVLIGLKEKDGSRLLSPEEIKAQTVELMFATMDNPSNAMEWALAEMINQPKILGRAMEELDRVVGKQRLVQESDLSQLNYLKSCLKESFRLHPIAPFNVPHVSTTDTTVVGYFIPKGSHVLLSRHGLGSSPRAWDEPLKFKPERHLKDDGSNVVLFDPDLKLLSFSIGRRGCPAVNLGSTMLTLLMARLLQGFSWELPPTVSKIELNAKSKGLLLLAEPLHAKAVPRLAATVYHQL